MSRDERAALAEVQAALVRALMNGEPPPAGVSAPAVERGRALLQAKQQRIRLKRQRKKRRPRGLWWRFRVRRPPEQHLVARGDE